MLKIDKKWQIKDKMPQNFEQDFSDINPIVLQILFNRHITKKSDIKAFLYGEFDKDSYAPENFNQMEAAIELIIKYIKANKKITIYGDYDADGVTSSALLYEILTLFKAKVDIYIPDRVSEGYGLNFNAIEAIAGQGTSLIITVDGGIRSGAEVEAARKLDLEVIVTDHHLPPEDKAELPDCIIINPALAEEKYPFKKLSGVGVAFKLAHALINKSKLKPDDKNRLINQIIDLAAIGTIADCVSVLGENRLIIKKGLEEINKTKRTGLLELIKVSGLENRKLEAWNIGWQIGPRLNAAGRMGNANTAYELLTTKDMSEAKVLASRLHSRNLDRQQDTEDIFKKVEANIDFSEEEKIIIGVCTRDASEGEEVWNEGVIGLVAGRLSNKYYRPALVITRTKEGYKGSGRSIPELNIVDALEDSKAYLDRYGGHAAACGFSMSDDKIDGFIENMRRYTSKKLEKIDLRPSINIDLEIDLENVNEDLVKKISELGPFGQDNEQPIFLSRKIKILDILYMGQEGQHIKLRVKSGDSDVISAVGFNQTEKWENVKIGDTIDMIYYLDINEFNGKTEPQMKIIDIK